MDSTESGEAFLVLQWSGPVDRRSRPRQSETRGRERSPVLVRSLTPLWITNYTISALRKTRKRVHIFRFNCLQQRSTTSDLSHWEASQLLTLATGDGEVAGWNPYWGNLFSSPSLLAVSGWREDQPKCSLQHVCPRQTILRQREGGR